jgi:AcrR family transcriptional regulator
MSTTPVAVAGTRHGQRERILDTALDLMSRRGASATSMRALAAACGLNVAALYHYFPSKDALLRAVIEERRYGSLLDSLPVPDLRLAPPDRLVSLVLAMWEGAREEAPIWRLLLSEALHEGVAAREMGVELRDALEAALVHALPRLVPEIAVDPEVAARAVSSTLLCLMIEASLVDGDAVDAQAERRARDLAAILLP